MNRRSGIQTIVAIGIGAAVFMILGRFGAIPTGIPNTSIETAYAFLALMAVLYLSLIHISEPTRPGNTSRMPSSA